MFSLLYFSAKKRRMDYADPHHTTEEEKENIEHVVRL